MEICKKQVNQPRKIIYIRMEMEVLKDTMESFRMFIVIQEENNLFMLPKSTSLGRTDVILKGRYITEMYGVSKREFDL